MATEKVTELDCYNHGALDDFSENHIREIIQPIVDEFIGEAIRRTVRTINGDYSIHDAFTKKDICDGCEAYAVDRIKDVFRAELRK